MATRKAAKPPRTNRVRKMGAGQIAPLPPGMIAPRLAGTGTDSARTPKPRRTARN